MLNLFVSYFAKTIKLADVTNYLHDDGAAGFGGLILGITWRRLNCQLVPTLWLVAREAPARSYQVPRERICTI